MAVTIRQETQKDYEKIYNLIKTAFESAEHSDGDEQDLVVRLRASEEFIPELSLIAEEDGRIAGHILFSKLGIDDGETVHESLALAPLAVIPGLQGRGVGSILVRAGLEKAKELAYGSCVVLGHERYYPKFGFVPASHYGISAPFEVPDSGFMAMELTPGGLDGVRGTVVYAHAFFDGPSAQESEVSI